MPSGPLPHCPPRWISRRSRRTVPIADFCHSAWRKGPVAPVPKKPVFARPREIAELDLAGSKGKALSDGGPRGSNPLPSSGESTMNRGLLSEEEFEPAARLYEQTIAPESATAWSRWRWC
jgi:hypothetical protein